MKIVTIENLQKYLDKNTDGSRGVNRQKDNNISSAKTDIEAVNLWLDRIKTSKNTYQSYRKEVERLYLWAVEQGKALSDLTLEDMERYKQFLSNPIPADKWQGPAKARTHNDWKPFTGPLSGASAQLSLTILKTAFSFFTNVGYLKYNPLHMLFTKNMTTTHSDNKVSRYLEQDVWQYFWDFIKKYPQENKKEKQAYHRRVFLFSMLYLLAPRISEVANHTMGSFIEERGKWWWQVTGKGNKTAKVPVPSAMMQALKTYRESLGLAPFPFPDDKTPLITRLNSDKSITVKMIHLIVKQTLADAAAALKDTAPAMKEKLLSASTHWFRHTSITHQADRGVDIRHLKATARHSSIVTTQGYLHEEAEAWHKDVEHHSL